MAYPNDRIIVEVPKGDGDSRRVAFRGRWLIEPTESADPRLKLGVRFQVDAEHKNSGPISFDNYADVDEAEGDGLPADIAAMVRSELDPSFIEELDI